MKRGSFLYETLVHIILIALIFAIFLTAVAGRVNARDVKQQVLEKQIALLIDSSEAGFSFSVSKVNVNGFVSDVRIENGRVFVVVDGIAALKGYPYFSSYEVSVEDVGDKFIVRIE